MLITWLTINKSEVQQVSIVIRKRRQGVHDICSVSSYKVEKLIRRLKKKRVEEREQNTVPNKKVNRHFKAHTTINTETKSIVNMKLTKYRG